MENRKGFTLFELMVVVLTMGVLFTLAVASYRGAVERSRARTALNVLRGLGESEKRYHLKHGRDPVKFSTLDMTVQGVLSNNCKTSGPNDCMETSFWTYELHPGVIYARNKLNTFAIIFATRDTGPFKAERFFCAADPSYKVEESTCHDMSGDTSPSAVSDGWNVYILPE